MGEQKALWGWYPTGNTWVKLQVAATGKLVIDPTALFEEPPTNGEMEKAATSNWSFDHDADPDAHHAAFTAADHLAIGDAAPHHAEAHTLASHTTKAHAELTGVGADDHHPQAHTLASHTTKAHAELTGVGADDHHPAFTSADHTAIGDAAPHHARLHTMSDALDHSGRIALTQMTDGAAGLVLTGQGAGSDPVYAAAAGGYTQGARVYNNAAITLTHAVWKLLTFNTERWDTDTIHDTVTNPGRLTCKTAGKYHIFGHVSFHSNATGYRGTAFKVNGATFIAAHQGVATSGTSTDLSISTVWDMAVTDYVEFWAAQTSGGDLTIDAGPAYSPEFGMQRIG